MANDENKEARKVLLAQASVLKLDVDGRWSVERLAEEVAAAQDAERAAKTAEVKAAADTWVTLLRAAFPVEDERHEIGETIKVPRPMAERWYAAGVALPGKSPKDD